MYAEEKWKASEEKVAYAKAFPSLMTTDEAKPVAKTFPLKNATLVLFDDSTFTFQPLDTMNVSWYMDNLREAKTHLYDLHKEAFDKLDELIKRDAELTRLSRMEKILGAIVNNIVEIPELRDEIPKVLDGTSTLVNCDVLKRKL
jgi:hypothetical protein